MPICVSGQSETNKGVPAIDFSVSSLKHGSGEFVILGQDSMEMLGLSKWVEEVVDRLEKKFGLEFPYGRSNCLRIVIRGNKPEPAGSNEVVTPGEGSNTGAIELTSVFDGERNVPTLIFHDYYNMDRDSAMEALTHFLLNGLVISNQTEVTLPAWLYRGMAQNLFVNDRRKNNEKVSEKWKNGEIGTVYQILSPDVSIDDSSIYGVFVELLLSMPQDSAIFSKMFGHMAAGGTIDREWLEKTLSLPEKRFDLDGEWDLWILRNKSRIYGLGRLDVELIRQLKAEMLLYNGSFGIPDDSGLSGAITFRDLIELKDKHWIKDVCRDKTARLQLLGLGKAREFTDVTNLYCGFLSALARGKSDWRLKGMLESADMKLIELQTEMGSDRIEK